MSEDIKRVMLTGAAATDMGGVPLAKKERAKRRTGGASSAPLTPSVPLASSAPLTPSAPLAPSVPNSVTPSVPAPSAPAPLMPSTEGGSKVIKVELKKRSTAKRVHLQPKSVKTKKSNPAPPAAQTKKSRKVTLAVSALHKRMSRAKKMTRKVKEMSLSQLREHLIQKKLIKPNSKAPESILRQMAADAQIVAGKAL